MKSKELIRLLQREDPTGETEVCIGNSDILGVARLPAWYDGLLEVFFREHPEGYPVGGAFVREGDKINLQAWSIDDCIWDFPDEFELDMESVPKHMQSRVKKRYEEALAFERELNMKYATPPTTEEENV